jgi:uncharacterized repeat protein (TIGR03806 family)
MLRRLGLLMLVAGCRGESTGGVPKDGQPPPPVDVEFGIETRPENSTCTARPRPITSGTLVANPAFPNLSFANPLAAVRQELVAGDDASYAWLIVEKRGTVQAFKNATDTSTTLFLDLSTVADDGPGEGGLLGMALDPNYTMTPGGGSHAVYVNYTGGTSGGAHACPLNEEAYRICTFISRFDVTSSDGGTTFTQSAETILMRIVQPYDNHNGGNIMFGPDGLLYTGLGDGGSGNDPHCNGQNVNTPYGKILRLDVRGSDVPYGIPNDNPFASTTALCNDYAYVLDVGADPELDIARNEPCPEIYAWGLRNPWRWSFDAGTGDLWVGDVGQNAHEEVDRVVKGGNYGWPIREGDFALSNNCAGVGPSQTYLPPVADYGRTLGNIVTGGYVYRGAAMTPLVGYYIFADSGQDVVWAIPANTTPTVHNPTPALTGLSGSIASMAEDEFGELYLVRLYAGRISKLELDTGGGGTTGFPALLSQTGCFDAEDPRQPASGLIPFDVNAKLWSDGAAKQRYLALPDGEQVHVDADGHFVFPIGTVLAKVFALNGLLLETRLLMHHDDGDWAGYTYVWNDAQTDAFLIDAHEDKDLGTQTWGFPSRSECLQCHTDVAGRSLGPDVAQLNGPYVYPPNLRANQLATLEHIGLFDAPLAGTPDTLAALPDPFDATAPLETRARAYLHANCAQCHRPSGPTPSPMDLRYATAFVDTNTCGATPSGSSFGVTNAELIAAGESARSLIWVRLHSETPGVMMPPLGRTLADEDAAALIADWIDSLAACP